MDKAVSKDGRGQLRTSVISKFKISRCMILSNHRDLKTNFGNESDMKPEVWG